MAEQVSDGQHCVIDKIIVCNYEILPIIPTSKLPLLKTHLFCIFWCIKLKNVVIQAGECDPGYNLLKGWDRYKPELD